MAVRQPATEPTPGSDPRPERGPAVEPDREPAREPARGGPVTLALASAAALLVLMNYTAPMTTLPQTAAALGAGVTGQTWMLNGISLGMAALLLVSGSLADDYGRKRAFVVGGGVLAAATVASAAAGSTLVFVVARVVQGGASAALVAASLGLVGHAFPAGPSRVRATGIWGATFGAGIALGPVLSAAFADTVSWRAVYWLLAVATLVLTVVALASLPESRAARPRAMDLPGVVTLGMGLAFLLAAVTEGRNGWFRPMVGLLFAAAAVLLAAFVVVEARRREPMLDLALFREPLFVTATGGALFTGLSVIGLMSYLPTILQRALGLGPLAVSGVFGIWSGMSVLTALQARRLAGRVTGRDQLALGLLLSAAGQLAMLGSAAAGSWVRMVPGLVVSGAGSGLLNAGLARLAIESVPAGRTAMGSGVNNTARYIGSSVGVALVVAAATTGGGSGHGADPALLVAAALAITGALATRPGRAYRPGRARRSGPRSRRRGTSRA